MVKEAKTARVKEAKTARVKEANQVKEDRVVD